MAFAIFVKGIDWQIDSATRSAAAAFVIAWVLLAFVIYASSMWDKRRPFISVVWLLAGALMAVIWWAYLPSPPPSTPRPAPVEVPRRIVLTPGLHPTPPGPLCTGDPTTPLKVSQGEIAVFFGDSIVTTSGQGTTIVSIDGEDVLSFRRATGTLYLRAVLRDALAHDVGQIHDNVVTLYSPDFEIQTPDAQHLEVLDSNGRRILSVWYVNESAMVVSGVFYGKRTGPFFVRDGESIALPDNRWTLSGNCSTNLDGPLFPLGRPHMR